MAESETERPRGPCRPGDPDEEPVARMLDGHAAAEELSKKYRGVFLKRALKSLHDRVRAEQVAQDTFVDAFNQLSTFKGQSSFFTWLYGIFKYRLLKELKAVSIKAEREVGFESESATRSADPEDQDTAQPKEADWITQIEQSVFTGRQHTPEKDHEVRERMLEVVSDIRESFSPQTKEVFYLMMADLSPAEIARLLDISESSVRNHIARGREALKEKQDKRGRDD